jgi:hypothetical protein
MKVNKNIWLGLYVNPKGFLANQDYTTPNPAGPCSCHLCSPIIAAPDLP